MTQKPETGLKSAAAEIADSQGAEAVEKLMWLIADEMVDAFDALFEPMLAEPDTSEMNAERQVEAPKVRRAGGRG